MMLQSLLLRHEAAAILVVSELQGSATPGPRSFRLNLFFYSIAEVFVHQICHAKNSEWERPRNEKVSHFLLNKLNTYLWGPKLSAQPFFIPSRLPHKHPYKHMKIFWRPKGDSKWDFSLTYVKVCHRTLPSTAYNPLESWTLWL